ncbi:hypothetical protein GEMRC1_009920 [Eukaryota sp. GEM-RC1]
MKLLLICFTVVLCTQAFKLPDSFTFKFHGDDDDLFATIDVDQKLDGFGRAKMNAVIGGGMESVSYIHKLGVPNGIMQSVFDYEGKKMCIETEDLFPLSNLYVSTMTLNGTIKYKDFQVEVWVNKKGPSGAQVFYAKDDALVAFGDIDEDDQSHFMVDVTGFEKRVFDRNHFMKPASIVCRRY